MHLFQNRLDARIGLDHRGMHGIAQLLLFLLTGLGRGGTL